MQLKLYYCCVCNIRLCVILMSFGLVDTLQYQKLLHMSNATRLYIVCQQHAASEKPIRNNMLVVVHVKITIKLVLTLQ